METRVEDLDILEGKELLKSHMSVRLNRLIFQWAI